MNQTVPCIAIVDDDPGLRRSLGRLLRAHGMQCVAYASAEAFLADTRPHQFDCFVLDVHLGGMSGLELALWLKAEGLATPVIFLSAYDDAQTRAQARRAGCAAYLRKAGSGAELLDAIRRVLA